MRQTIRKMPLSYSLVVSNAGDCSCRQLPALPLWLAVVTVTYQNMSLVLEEGDATRVVSLRTEH